MSTCAACQTEVSSEDNFCPECGTRTDPRIATARVALQPEATETARLPDQLDLFRYHDLTKRLAVFSTDGGVHLRGDREDLAVRGGEPAMYPDEEEHARVGGILQLVGARSTEPGGTPTLGLVFEGMGSIVVTSQRLIVMLVQGESQLGRAGGAELHTFVLPWDLVSSIDMPAKKSFSDRLAGGRTIAVFGALTFTRLTLNPVKKAELRGREVKVTDEEVMDILVRAGATHRMSVSPSGEQSRLAAVRDGARITSEGELVAALSPEDVEDIPPHLLGRLVERSGEDDRA